MLVKAVDGSEFEINCEDPAYISTLAAGYIITKNGELVLVRDQEDHSSVFTNYINQYEKNNKSEYQHYESVEGAMHLVKDGNIVYLGIKIKDAYKSSSNSGYGIIVLPSNLDFNEEQGILLKKLLDSNKSIFSGDKLQLQIASGYNEEAMTIEEFAKLVESKTGLTKRHS